MDPIEQYGQRLSDESLARYRRRSDRQKREFLRGPIPLDWIVRAKSLPRQALAVALAIWFLKGLRRKGEIKFNPSTLTRFKIDRWSAYRGLQALEAAGLIRVDRHRGRAPLVTILEVSPP